MTGLAGEPLPDFRGGWTEDRPPDDNVRYVCNAVKYQFEKQTNKKVTTFEAVIYKSHVDAGTTYIIRVHLGKGNCCDLHIYKPQTNEEPKLLKCECDKSMDAPLPNS